MLDYNQVASQSPEAAGPWQSNSSGSSLFTPGIFPPPHSSGLLGYPQHSGRTDRLICHLSNRAHRVLPQGLGPDQRSAFFCILLKPHTPSAGVPPHRGETEALQIPAVTWCHKLGKWRSWNLKPREAGTAPAAPCLPDEVDCLAPLPLGALANSWGSFCCLVIDVWMATLCA